MEPNDPDYAQVQTELDTLKAELKRDKESTNE
jgi:hypothetical protein